MEFTVTQGKAIRTVLPLCRRLGLPVPDAIKNAPTLLPGLEFYFSAYQDLSTCRSGMGDGPISWTAVMDYADRCGMDTAQAITLWQHTKAMDLAYSRMKKDDKPE